VEGARQPRPTSRRSAPAGCAPILGPAGRSGSSLLPTLWTRLGTWLPSATNSCRCVPDHSHREVLDHKRLTHAHRPTASRPDPIAHDRRGGGCALDRPSRAVPAVLLLSFLARRVAPEGDDVGPGRATLHHRSAHRALLALSVRLSARWARQPRRRGRAGLARDEQGPLPGSSESTKPLQLQSPNSESN